MDSVAHDTFVTERLAAGLARQAIRDWRDRVQRSEARLLDLARRDFSTSKGVTRVARDLNKLLAPFAFHSVSKAFKRHGTRHALTLPQLRTIDDTEYLAIEANLFAVDLDGFRHEAIRPLAYVHPHALARMFLRMQTIEFAEVREQLGFCLHYYSAIAVACQTLELRQIVIPTKSGHFRCDVRMDLGEPAALLAKTWLATSPSTLRDLRVLESIAQGLIEWRKDATDVEHSRMGFCMTAPESFTRRLVEGLRAHAWLREAYEERPDHLSTMWEAARRSAG